MADIWNLCQDEELRNNPKPFYTDHEAARVLGMSPTTVFRLRKKLGRIRETRFSAQSVYIRHEDLESFMRGETALDAQLDQRTGDDD
jgi:hypothetical protein